MLTIDFDNSYARDLEGMYLPFDGAPAPEPALYWLNEALAEELRLSPATLRSPEGVAMLAGSAMPDGASPLAMAYAGHQFGGFSPQLGDGRAMPGARRLRAWRPRSAWRGPPVPAAPGDQGPARPPTPR